MSRLTHFVALLAAPFSLLCCNPAWAEGTSTASISNVRLQVFDLTPDDGIAAGYDIDLIQPSLTGLFWSAPIELTKNRTPAPYVPDTVRVDFGPSFGQAHTDGPIGALSSAAVAHGDLGRYALASGKAEQWLSLTLRPNTVLAVSGHLNTVAQHVIDDETYDVQSTVRIHLSDPQGNHNASLLRYSWSGGPEDGYEALDEDFAVTYGNGTGQDMAVILSLLASSAVTAIPAPVPEPGTWLMLSAGLAGLGMAARSRRKC